MKYVKIALSLLIVGVFATSCDKSFEEINANNNQPEQVTVDVLLTAAQNAQLNDYGGFGTGIWDAFTQHQAGNHARGVDYDQYRIISANENGTWTGLYVGALKDYNQIMTQGVDEGNLEYVGVAKILTAFGLGYLTSMYGDIPWSQAFGEEQRPSYDSQASIYAEMLRLVQEARTDLGGGTVVPLSNGDFIYNGDASKWVALSHALEARWNLHLGNMGAAASSANAAISAGFSDFMMKYEGGSQHQSRWGSHWENNTVIASAVFMRDLYESPVLTAAGAADTRDPRLEAYFDNSRFPDNDTLPEPLNSGPNAYSGVHPMDGTRVAGTHTGYTGKANGWGVTNDSFSPVGPYGAFGKYESSTPLVTTAEVQFIIAEASLGSNQGAADAAFRAGAIASIDQVFQFGYDAYSARMDASDPDLPVHQAALQQRRTDYINAINAMSNVTLEQVMTEKFRAMMAMEAESWIDLRRHGYAYPTYLSIPVDGSTGAPVASTFIQRFLYPQDELNKNLENVPSTTIFDKHIFSK